MILCCGESLIDMLPHSGENGDDGLIEPVTGGAVFNTAIALGRLGAETGFFSGMSADKFGRMLRTDLDESNVSHSLCTNSPKPTTLAFVDLDGGEATYTFYDVGTAGQVLSIGDLPQVPDVVTAMVFGGISLIPEPCGTAYQTFLARNSANKVIYLDPNIRANFIEDADTHRSRIRQMIANSDIVKVSEDDLAWIEPDLDEDAAIGLWLKGGTSLVLVSRGGDGAEAHGRNGVVRQSATPVTVVDTVGAGDTFNAGFLTSLAEQGCLQKSVIGDLSDSGIRQALLLATRAAAVTASRKGANPPWRNELEGSQ